MEKEISIKTPDKKLIYGTLGKSKNKSDTLVIFVHGFTGHQNEHIFFNGSRFLAGKGCDTFRFNLYSWQKDARHFKDVKISLHGKDITTVVKYFRKKYKKIFLIGHSYGGASLLFAETELVDGLVFWDASYIDSRYAHEDLGYDKKTGKYIYDFGIEYFVGKEFIDELRNFPDCGDLIKKIHKPVLFIVSGREGNVKAEQQYFIQANKPKARVNIKHADHCFDNWEDEKRLLDETWAWLRKYI